MKAPRTNFAGAAALGLVIATTAIASAYAGEALAPQALVRIEQARTMARNVVPGTILSEELEKEAGGSGLRYTFDIKGKSGVREVGIDAKTGTVLENTSDSVSPTNKSIEGNDEAGD